MALATIDDINAFLPPNVVEADDVNIASINIQVERYVKAYLAKVAVTSGWTTVDLTPSTVQLVGAMLAASQLYFINTSATSLDIDERNFGELLYQRAIELLHGMVDGTIDMDGENDGTTQEISRYILTFWPDETAPRYFTSDMEFG